jgi:hypothetical protein
MAAMAVPVQYDMTFNATVGSNGVGSFTFDADSGAMNDFGFDFGGTIGGLPDLTWMSFGDTVGRFVFELLTRTDVHPVVDCINGGCSLSAPITGSGPSGANYLNLSTGPLFSPALYSFRLVTATSSASDPNLAEGTVTVTQRVAAVPEPSTFALYAAGLFGVAFIRRRRNA